MKCPHMLIQTTSYLVRIDEFKVTAAKLVDEPFIHCAEARTPRPDKTGSKATS